MLKIASDAHFFDRKNIETLTAGFCLFFDDKVKKMENTKQKKHLLKRFMKYYRPHRTLFFADMTATVFLALIGIVYPIVTRLMLNDLIPNRNYKMVVTCGVALLALYVIKMLLNYFVQYYGHVMGVRMQAQMRSDMFNHLEKLPFSFYDNHETGKIMSRMTNDLMDISELAGTIKKMNEYKLEINDFLDILSVWYRDALIFKATNDANGLIFRDQLNNIKGTTSRSTYEGIENILEALDIAKKRISANVDFNLTMELLLLSIKENCDR